MKCNFCFLSGWWSPGSLKKKLTINLKKVRLRRKPILGLDRPKKQTKKTQIGFHRKPIGFHRETNSWTWKKIDKKTEIGFHRKTKSYIGFRRETDRVLHRISSRNQFFDMTKKFDQKTRNRISSENQVLHRISSGNRVLHRISSGNQFLDMTKKIDQKTRNRISSENQVLHRISSGNRVLHRISSGNQFLDYI